MSGPWIPVVALGMLSALWAAEGGNTAELDRPPFPRNFSGQSFKGNEYLFEATNGRPMSGLDKVYARPDTAMSADISGDPTVYGYHDEMALGLSFGFDPKDVTQYKRRCIAATHVEIDPGAVSTTVTVDYVKSRDQLNFSMKLESKADAAYLAAKGSARFAIDTSLAFKDNSLTVVMTAASDYGRWGLGSDAALTSEATALLADGRAFAATCGTRFVAAERRGASVSAIITIRSVSSDFKASFESEMSAGGGWGPLSASAKQKFSAAFRYANEQSRVDVQVFSTGGEGLPTIKSGIENISFDEKDPIGAISKSLAGFLAGFTEENASPTKYYIGSMKLFGWDPDSIDPWTDAKERSLRAIVAKYREIAVDVDLLASLHDGSSKLLKIFDKPFVERLLQSEADVKRYLDALAESHKKCKEDKDSLACEMPRGYGIGGINLLSLLDPPTIKFSIYGFNEQQTSLILNTAKGRRLQLAQSFQPGTTAIAATIYPYGGLNTVAYRSGFRYDDGSVSYSDWVGGDKGANVWFIEPAGSIAADALEDLEWGWYAKHNGDWSGLSFWEIEDRAGQRFELPYQRVRFTAKGGNLTKMEWETLF
ncbi:hypothetical protein [Sinorhizobium meliloti]|jgi:hypothetical protein|uniref:hypothetical protein n=1 Tax=Rhizobium meliloti TaxID=382 RepID=UPI0020BD900C|nr:hypothetical protein [Sinorhizobium meliloti]